MAWIPTTQRSKPKEKNLNQSEYNRLKVILIKPIQAAFDQEFTPDQCDFIMQETKTYNDETIEEAVRELREEERRPAPVRIVHVVRQVAGRHRRDVPFHRSDQLMKGSKALAEKVLRSPIGQQALRAGVGRELWLKALCEGKQEFTERDILQGKIDAQKAIETLSEYPSKNDGLYAMLEKLQNKMMLQEQYLQEKYLEGSLRMLPARHAAAAEDSLSMEVEL